MFDKEEQRRRAAEMEFLMQQRGIQAPVLPTIHVSPQVNKFAPVTIGPEDKRHPHHKEWKAAQPKKVKGPNPVDFTNNIGQVIKPGDKIICITTGYSHRVQVRQGTYLGLSKSGKPSVEVLCQGAGGYWYNGKRLSTWEARNKGVQYSRRDVMQKVTLQSKRVYKIA